VSLEEKTKKIAYDELRKYGVAMKCLRPF